MLQCGAVAVIAPEPHLGFQLVFNDDGGTILVGAYDQNGQLLTDRVLDTRADAALLGIVAVDQVYRKVAGTMASGSDRRVARLELASCGGGLHEIILE